MSKSLLLVLCGLASVLGFIWMVTGNLSLGDDLVIVGIVAVLVVLSLRWGLE